MGDAKHNERCRLTTLARGSTAHVQRCTDCGSLSLHVGPITLRFDAAALESLWNTVGEALLEHHRVLKNEGASPLRTMAPRGRA